MCTIIKESNTTAVKMALVNINYWLLKDKFFFIGHND
jgi:hypothetical protein